MALLADAHRFGHKVESPLGHLIGFPSRCKLDEVIVCAWLRHQKQGVVAQIPLGELSKRQQVELMLDAVGCQIVKQLAGPHGEVGCAP